MRKSKGPAPQAWVFQIVLVVKRVISELTGSVADIDLGKKCPCEVGCPHLHRLGTAIIRIKRESRPKSKPTTRAKRIYSFKLISLAPGVSAILSGMIRAFPPRFPHSLDTSSICHRTAKSPHEWWLFRKCSTISSSWLPSLV